MLLEEARLRCGTMLDQSESNLNPDCLSLNGLYGDLGIAGYYASARLEPRRRRQLLAQARARSRRGDTAPHRADMAPPVADAASCCDTTSIRALSDVTAAATRTVERALTLSGLLDHMHLAHIHVMSACEALDAMFALQA